VWRTVHDVSLAGWVVLAVLRAVRGEPAGRPDAAVVVVNLATGTPTALARVRARRRDPAALLAPPAVAAALWSTAVRSGTWWPVAATAALATLAVTDRRRG
jgi:UDP-glucose 4-epimerase